MLFLYCVCHAFASAHCCLVVTCCESGDLLAIVGGVKLCGCCYLFGILGQVWFMIVSIPHLCLFSYCTHSTTYIGCSGLVTES